MLLQETKETYHSIRLRKTTTESALGAILSELS